MRNRRFLNSLFMFVFILIFKKIKTWPCDFDSPSYNKQIIHYKMILHLKMHYCNGVNTTIEVF